MDYLHILKCPITNNALNAAEQADISALSALDVGEFQLEISEGLVAKLS